MPKNEFEVNKGLYKTLFAAAAAPLMESGLENFLKPSQDPRPIVDGVTREIMSHLPGMIDRETKTYIGAMAGNGFLGTIMNARVKVLQGVSPEQIADGWNDSINLMVDRVATLAAGTGWAPKPQNPSP